MGRAFFASHANVLSLQTVQLDGTRCRRQKRGVVVCNAFFFLAGGAGEEEGRCGVVLVARVRVGKQKDGVRCCCRRRWRAAAVAVSRRHRAAGRDGIVIGTGARGVLLLLLLLRGSSGSAGCVVGYVVGYERSGRGHVLPPRAGVEERWGPAGERQPKGARRGDGAERKGFGVFVKGYMYEGC